MLLFLCCFQGFNEPLYAAIARVPNSVNEKSKPVVAKTYIYMHVTLNSVKHNLISSAAFPARNKLV